MARPELWLPPREICEATCEVCPAQLLRFGTFDVSDRPGPDSQFDPAKGWRANRTTGAPTCVHPYRVGLPPARYASDGVPLPEPETPTPEPAAHDLDLPDDPTLLEAWLVAVLRVAAPETMASALFEAEAIASARFDSRQVVAAMRRVMSYELAGG